MKKIAVIVLALIMCFALTGCGSSSSRGTVHKNTCKYCGNTESGVKQTRNKSCDHTCDYRAKHRDPYVDAHCNKHSTNGGTGSNRAVDRKIGKIKHLEGYVKTYRHYTPDKSLPYGAGKSPEPIHDYFHLKILSRGYTRILLI